MNYYLLVISSVFGIYFSIVSIINISFNSGLSLFTKIGYTLLMLLIDAYFAFYKGGE